ncbi:MAG: hypothetical protein V3U07_05400, partial [Nitrospirales bacterium]
MTTEAEVGIVMCPYNRTVTQPHTFSNGTFSTGPQSKSQQDQQGALPMDIKHTQSSQKETTGPKNSNMDKDRSDSREIIFLASGLLALMLGIGGILMYSENEPLAPTASQAANSVNLAKAMSSSLSEPQVSSALNPNPEPSINLSTHLGIDPDSAQGEEPTKVYFEFNQSTLSEEAKDIIT